MKSFLDSRPSPRRPRLPAAVVALGVTSFFTDVGAEMIFPLLPLFITSLGGAPAFLGLVEGLADATSSLLKFASGYIADRTRAKKPLVVAGYVAATIVRPLVALATSPWHILAVRVTDRVGKGIRSTPRDVLIASSVAPEEAGRAFGFHHAMDHAGAVVGPLVAMVLLSLGWSLRAVFAAALVPGVLSVAAVLTVKEPSAPSAATGEQATAIGAQSHLGSLPRSLRSYFAILALFSLGNSSDAFLLLRARDVGVPISRLPLLWMVFHVAKLVSSYVGGSWSDRIARWKLIVGGWILYGGTYFAFGTASQPWHAWMLFVVYGLYYGLTEPAEKALVKDLAPANLRGRAYGHYNFITGVTAIPAGLLTGWLWERWSPPVALMTGAGIAAASSLALVIWAKTLRTTKIADAG